MDEAIRIGVIGLGEAGSLIAGGLQARGASVVGFDPATPADAPVPTASSVAEAVAGADIVLSINSSTVALAVAKEAAPALEPNAIYADLNTGTPAMKRTIASVLPDGVFADVAIMKPVPGLAEGVPMSVAGPAARRFIDRLGPLGLDLDYVSDVTGEAAARKLLRSILAKGIASVLIDTLWAAESMGLHEWAYEEILREFDSTSSGTAKRYLSGTAQHVKRRQIEMMDVSEMLNEAGYQSTMVDGVALTYSRILHSKKVPFSTAP
jgi:L-threonate 2-dehydrogenase